MTNLKRNSYTLIKIVPFVSILFFMTGVMLLAVDEFDCDKYLRIINIIPVCIAVVTPYFTKDLKDYSTIILGLLCILSYSEFVAPKLGFFVPYANGVMFSEIFAFSNYRMIILLNVMPVFLAFCCSLFNIKFKKSAIWISILLNLASIIFVLIKDPLWINKYDYYFSGSYIMLLLSALVGFYFYPLKKTDKTK